MNPRLLVALGLGVLAGSGAVAVCGVHVEPGFGGTTNHGKRLAGPRGAAQRSGAGH